MGRNTGGVYTLPGAAFVSGTVISSTAMNAKLADIAAALTDSLSRSGDGDMTAELRVPDGSAALPTLSWTNDPGTGFYLAATSSFRAVILAATVQEWTSTGVSIQKPLTCTSTLAVTGTTTLTGATASTTVTNGTAITATGNGTGNGVSGIGGSSGASTSTGVGVLGTGGGSGPGLRGIGGSGGGDGLVAVGGGSSGRGINVLGGTGQAGALITAGTAATATVAQNAVRVAAGYIAFENTTNPNSNVALSNSITPANFDKAWAYVRSDGAGGAILEDGFNIASVGIVGTAIQVTFATAFSGLNYAPTLSHLGASPRGLWFSGMTTTSILLNVSDMAGVTTDLSTTAIILMFRATGKQ